VPPFVHGKITQSNVMLAISAPSSN